MLDPEVLSRAYASADLCAQPSEIEPVSNAVLEALTSGLPVLVASASGTDRPLVDGETGMVVRGGAEAWAEAVSALVTDERRRVEMGRAARALALRASDPLAPGAARGPASDLASRRRAMSGAAPFALAARPAQLPACAAKVR